MLMPTPCSYKAIVLFTPGGDVFYTVDQDKTRHWHFDLCLAIQSLLKLQEAPHFLVPYYTATIDVSLDPITHIPHVLAEAHPLVYRYRYFLNALFNLDPPGVPKSVFWKSRVGVTGSTDPAFLQHYAQQFPQLWDSHNWVVSLDQILSLSHTQDNSKILTSCSETSSSIVEPEQFFHSTPLSCKNPGDGYVLRLFVSGHGSQTEQSLKELHRFLKQELTVPYSLKVIDICRYPDLAEQDQITAIPTLVRVWPKPIHRIVGHFNHSDQLSQLLQPDTVDRLEQFIPVR